MNVLVACEFSGRVRDAFRARGHNAVSCDLLETEVPGPHYVGDARSIPLHDVDLLIAFPPCTHLASSGALHFKNKVQEQKDAIEFARYFIDAPVKCVCVENPIGVLSTYIRKPDQVIQPWYFGHPATKATCLWLRGLSPLTPTKIVNGGGYSAVLSEQPGPDRWKNRSRTYQGVADAMAAQWG